MDIIVISEKELLIVTDHAAQRMIQRKITEDDIAETYMNPDATWDHISGNTKNYQKEIAEQLIKIGVKLKKSGKHILVTAIKKDKQ